MIVGCSGAGVGNQRKFIAALEIQGAFIVEVY
jgi:hypothetical protein